MKAPRPSCASLSCALLRGLPALLVLSLLLPCTLRAQGGDYTMREGFRDYNTSYTGEIGAEAGTASYFGDLNTRTALHAMKFSAGLFYRHFFNNYLGASLHLHYAQLGYSDLYNENSFQHTRNLSFNTDIWDLTLQGDFNFFAFSPGSLDRRFTPYLTFGLGAFHYNPYAYYGDQKYYLQPLGTEGQGSSRYPDRKPYALWSWDLPLGIGIKYNLNSQWNASLSATHRFTGTDYLDDVSTTYAGADLFGTGPDGKPGAGALLQDRSGAYGPPIGQAGRQRGNSRDRDQFLFVEIGIAYLFTRYQCPDY